MNFDAIIFDLDGTLVDSLEDIADSMNRVLEDAGLPAHPTADYRYFIGDGIDMLTQRALPEEHRSAPEVKTFRCRHENGVQPSPGRQKPSLPENPRTRRGVPDGRAQDRRAEQPAPRPDRGYGRAPSGRFGL